jgi:hypothetical protein
LLFSSVPGVLVFYGRFRWSLLSVYFRIVASLLAALLFAVVLVLFVAFFINSLPFTLTLPFFVLSVVACYLFFTASGLRPSQAVN